jgi:hypothetical protein
VDIQTKSKGIYLVRSTKEWYEVRVPGLVCTCPNFKYKKVFCKHIREVCARIVDGTIDQQDRSNSIGETEARHYGKI